jgi:hypothetical protein
VEIEESVMGEEKHLLRPWEIAQIDTRRLYQDDNLVEAVAAIRVGSSAYRLTFSGITTEEDFMAIIRLVAAAPDLLELAEIVQRATEDTFKVHASLIEIINEKARAVIAKATAA